MSCAKYWVQLYDMRRRAGNTENVIVKEASDNLKSDGRWVFVPEIVHEILRESAQRQDKIVSRRRGILDRTFATKSVGQPKRKTSASKRVVHLAAGPMNPREIRLKDRMCGNKSNLMSLKPWILGPLYGAILETAG